MVPNLSRRLSVVGALLITTGGYVHLSLYRNGYRFIPTIGVSFVIEFASSAVLAGALLLPVRRTWAQLARFAPSGSASPRWPRSR